MIPVVDSRRRRRSLTAAGAAPVPAAPLGLGLLRRSTTRGRHQQVLAAQRGLSTAGKAKVAKRTDWVGRAYDAYENIPEVGFVVDLSATTMALGALRLQWRNDDGDWVDPRIGVFEDVDVNGTTESRRAQDDPDDLLVADLLGTFEPEDGEQADLAERFAINDQIAGECYIIAKPPTRADIKTGEVADVAVTVFGNMRFAWDVHSVLEVKADQLSNAITLDTTGGARSLLDEAKDSLPADAYISRYWRRDPRKSDQATSAIRRVLPICDELQALNRAILTAVESQANSGVMIVVDGMRLFGGGDETAESSEDDIALLALELEEHFTATADAGDRTLRAPLIFLAPDTDTATAVRMVDTWRKFDSVLIELRTAARSTLAVGFDAPPEVLNGKAGLSHWTGYSVDQDFLLRHIQPRGNRWARFVTSDMLRPMLELNEKFKGDLERYRVVYDVSPLTAKPDMTGTVLELDKRDAIKDEAVLRHLGVPESDAATDEERAVKMRRRMAQTNPAFAVLFAEALGLTELIGLDWHEFAKATTAKPGDSSSSDGPAADPSAGPSDSENVDPPAPAPAK